MFWGLIMEPNKRYTQIVEKAFHVSMATLDVTTADDEIVQVMLCYENRNYLLCNLKKGSQSQNSLDLNFKEGTKIAFTSNGSGHVHLTGYLLDDDELDDYDEVEEEEDEDEVEEEEEEEDVPQLVSKQGKRKALKSPAEIKSTKRLKALVDSIEASNENSDDDEDDDDSDAEAEDASLEVEDDDSEEDDDDAEEEEDSDEEEEDEVEDIKPQQKKNKQQTQQKQQPQQQPKQKNQKDQKLQNSLTNGKDAKAKQVDKKAEQTSMNNSQAQKKKVLTGGVVIEDIKVGNGNLAKQGKFVSVYYIGKLKNGKKFDSTTNGDGFKFRLGKGEVIKGWDIGVQGMKVGGKRRITIPPAMAYGAKGSPPVIPGNSTLTFEVELKNVH